MVNPIARMLDKPPPSRLEHWLMKKLQGGCLKALPRYFPLGVRGGRCPEPYARDLLAGLRAAQGNVMKLERLKDDGRAFRSWAESAVSHVPHRANGRSSIRSQGIIAG
jgi:hypothetical protein